MDIAEAVRHASQSRAPGQHRMICPECSHNRKPTNQRTETLSIKVEASSTAYQCHHCGVNGVVKTDGGDQRRAFAPKSVAGIEGALSTTALRFLQQRKIEPRVAEAYGVKTQDRWVRDMQSETACICFPYTHGDAIYAWKYRALLTKAFGCEGAPATFFGLDQVDPSVDQIVITEGEMDVLAMATAGVKNPISVPNGAVMMKPDERSVDPRDDGKFKFVWHANALLANAKKVIIATDGDAPGQAMANELARRIGRAKCWRISWPAGAKDPNDVLLQQGATRLLELVAGAEPWPVAGLYGAGHYRDRVLELYTSGCPVGVSTGYRDLDQLYRVVPGQLTVVTGTPGHGKSQFLDNLMINVTTSDNWRFGICSFETPPQFHLPKLLSLAAGQSFYEQNGSSRMPRQVLDRWLDWAEERFTFIEQASGAPATIESVLERATAAVQRNGIRGLIIDPYNYLLRDGDENETRYVSNMLTQVRNFAVAHDVHVWFVAHPTKLQRVDGRHPIPKGWDISGSMAWFAKADNGMTVYRPEEGGAEIHLWKVRWSWCGRPGVCKLDYDNTIGQFREEKW